MSATIKLEKNHFPVLLDELVSIISPLYSGTFIDCTFGNGGYSKEILKNKQNKVIAIDRDIDAIEVAKQLKKKYNKQFNFHHLKFSEVNKIEKIGDDLKGIIFDLGFSSIQVRDPNKGMSFYNQGKLDMRMGLNKTSADEAINNLSYSELNNIFKFLGEEKKGKSISKAIINERKKKLINTPDLVKIVDYAKNFKRGKTHNSTQVFQALRIYVNKEIHELIIKDETLKKGEMVIVIEGSKEKQLISVEHEKVLFEEIQKLNGTKAASKIVSKISSKTSKEIYSIFSESKNDK